VILLELDLEKQDGFFECFRKGETWWRNGRASRRRRTCLLAEREYAHLSDGRSNIDLFTYDTMATRTNSASNQV